jgi:hypothetical protein
VISPATIMVPDRTDGAQLCATVYSRVTVVGSGIAATRLTTEGALRLLVSAVATALGLAVLILVFAQSAGAFQSAGHRNQSRLVLAALPILSTSVSSF